MNRPRLVVLVALALLVLTVPFRLCRRAAAPTRSGAAPAPLEIPPPPPPPARGPEPRAVAGGRPEHPPERLRPFLERLGRARLLRDAATLTRLRAAFPPVYESDVPWIAAQVKADLFHAAGAAEFVMAYRLSSAVPALAEALAGPSHPFLKDVVIDSLGTLGGDAAVASLLGALRADPDAGVRSRAAAALARFEGPEAYHALVAALRDTDPGVRSAACAALGRLKSREAVEALFRALEDEREPGVQGDLAMAAYASGGEACRQPVIQAIQARPAAAQVLQNRVRARSEARYRRAYERTFFEPGGAPAPFDGARRQIGITLELGPAIPVKEVAAAIFAAAPFDRYRAWFRFRRADEFPLARAYDSYGSPVDGVLYDDLDGTVFLRFKDPQSFQKGVLGYTKGCEAFVTGVSLLHELGHAFARLGDEYAKGSTDDAANLARTVPPPWQPLIEAGLLPPPVRRDDDFFIPSENCHLGNRPFDSRFCPVCQLEILARISETAGAPLPW